MLALLYCNPEYGMVNEVRAAKWFGEAAAQGDPTAQVQLGMRYGRGGGVPQDYVLAYMWLNLALAQDSIRPLDAYFAKEEREELSQRMTPDQIADAQARARHWRSGATPDVGGATPEGQSAIVRGTGFAVGPDGTFVTSHHVVAGATSVKLRLADGSAHVAQVIRSSPRLDVVVLRIRRPTPVYLSLAGSGSIEPGDFAFTMGYPAVDLLGSEPKYTEGTISALSGPGGDASFLQISVPIQPGNSGGPLLNHSGDVVGVVAATAAVTRFFESTGALPQNINWALNADFVRPLIPVRQLAHKRVRESAVDRVRRAICLVEATR
jgi:hypothetical protein